ncbi:GNAT family N-acetyltransferase [Bifidobacterium phasiani]|uniref:GNAT family N-acetyltransferase n=1 Tax=Bifidobacterium phasiani TaxID=2834431 RepID=A0ABS6W9E2_9BIFI|nr:GNAT family N-acetyltransferase [Bifidobacterium phasiani]MBW3083104.1 GNAT family N-acetyltransferase [Bifidobacterium phasiani]
MDLVIKPLTQEHALEIADEWKYDGEYAFYDMTADVEDYEEFVDEDLRNRNDHYEVWENDRLIGFFCVVKEDRSIEIGLGMRPDMCGKGMGRRFVGRIVEFIEEHYRFDRLVMSVASFQPAGHQGVPFLRIPRPGDRRARLQRWRLRVPDHGQGDVIPFAGPSRRRPVRETRVPSHGTCVLRRGGAYVRTPVIRWAALHGDDPLSAGSHRKNGRRA